jgi:glycosyltransferase involved in cell wall biosynthesis
LDNSQVSAQSPGAPAAIRVLVLTHGFPPVGHSGVFRTAAFVKHLPGFGIQPYILTATDKEGGLQFYEGQDLPPNLESLFVKRVPWQYQKSPISNTALRWLVTRMPILSGIYRKARRRKFIHSLLPVAQQIVRDHKIQAIYASSPPAEALLIGDALARNTGLPLISDLRDPWAYGWEARYRSIVDFWMERQAEKGILDRSAVVIANTPTARKQLIENYKISPKKIVVVSNGYDDEEFERVSTGARGLDAHYFNLIYTGALVATENPSGLRRMMEALSLHYVPMAHDSSTRSPFPILDALKIAGDRDPQFLSLARFHIIGELPSELVAQIKSHPSNESVILHGAEGASEANALCAVADLVVLLQISMFRAGENFCTAVPAKLFNYLRSGTRIFAPIQESDSTDIIRRFSAGIVADPQDSEACATALLDEFQRWRNGGTEHRRSIDYGALAPFERRQLTVELANVIRNAVTTMPSSVETRATVIDGVS